MRRPELSIGQILSWADFYHERTGQWPRKDTARFVYNAVGEKWYNIDAALRQGLRGLPGKSSLAQLLAERRGVRNIQSLPPFKESTILAWADAYYRRHKSWPKKNSEIIAAAPSERWSHVDTALWYGLRGLSGNSSLARLLAERRGVRHKGCLPKFTAKMILRWADAYKRRHQKWPHHDSGPIAEAPGETWGAVHSALQYGIRGLPKGSSLARFLEHHRGIRNHLHLPRLTPQKILAWADEFHRRTGNWPTRDSGQADEATGETWATLNSALHQGNRGLPGGSSLARLLEKYRQVPNRKNRPRLTYEQILRWADAHHRRTGRWPGAHSGLIPEKSWQSWIAVDTALSRGTRGLPKGTSLAQLLSSRRGVRNVRRLTKLSNQQILAWADRFHQLRRRWPSAQSGPIPGTQGESWMGIHNALRAGFRGLPGGSSLAQFLSDRRGVRNIGCLPQLSTKQILAWADRWHRRTGVWPTVRSGAIPGAKGETWMSVENALRLGLRGLPKGSSLFRFLQKHRGGICPTSK
jgi:hypothetical protein